MPLPFQRRGGAQLRPTFSRDFAGLKTLDHGVGPAITFTRASNATFFDASGVLQTAANDVPRFDHSTDGAANSLGLLIEESRTNSIRNSQAGGSTNGVIGVTGVAPNNWTITANANGVTSEVIGTGTEDGLSYIDIKVSGTPTASGTVFLQQESNTQVVAANGQTWTASAYVKLASGAHSNVSTQLSLRANTTAGAQVAGQGATTTFTPTSAALKTQRVVATPPAFTDATVERVTQFVRVNYTNGNAFDLTLRIAAPQLEQGAFPTSYIPTTTAAATRSADSAVVTPISSFYNQAEGTLFAEFNTPVGGVGVVAISDNSIDNRLSIVNAASTLVPIGRVTAAAVNQYSFSYGSAPAVTDILKIIVAAKADDFHGARGGALGTADTSGTMPVGLTHLRLGTTGSTFAHLNGHIRKIAYWPKRLSNALLQQLTT